MFTGLGREKNGWGKEQKKKREKVVRSSGVTQVVVTSPYLLFFIYINLFILFLAALGLCCCVLRAFSSCGSRGPLFVVVRGLLTAVASLVVEHGLQIHGLQ